MNGSLNSLLQAASRSSGKEFLKNVIGEQKKHVKKKPPPKEKLSSDDEPDSDSVKQKSNKIVLKSASEKTQRKLSLEEANDSDDGQTPSKKVTAKRHEIDETKKTIISPSFDSETCSIKKSKKKKKSADFIENDEEVKSPKKHKKTEEKQSVQESNLEFPQTPKKRKSSISFNEMQDDLETSIEKKKKKSKSEPTNSLKKLLPDAETTLYLLKLPKDIDAKDLIGKNIPINKTGKVRLNKKQKLEIKPKENSSSNCHIFAPNLFHLGHIEKVLHAKRYIKVKQDVLEPTPNNFDVEQRVKERHPIFGSSFSEDLQMEKSVVDRLENSVKSKKKKHLKLEVTDDNQSLQNCELSAVDVCGEGMLKKKKKKKKEKEKEQTYLEEVLDVYTEKKKKKKEKTNEVAEMPVKKKKKQKEDSDSDIDVISILSETKQKILGTC